MESNLVVVQNRKVTALSGPVVPALVAASGTDAALRFLDFFATQIENDNTRAAYVRAAREFLAWCDGQKIGLLTNIQPVHVAAWIKQLKLTHSVPTVKLRLAAIRHLFDWLVMGHATAPVFYSSMHKESVFFELPDLTAGDELILTFWKTTERMVVNNIGYTEFAFQALGAKRAVPTWEPPNPPGDTVSTVSLATLPPEVVIAALEKDENHELKEAFSKYFMRKVPSGALFRYKLTVVISEMHLGAISPDRTQFFAGILYPSVRMWANGDNLALLPWFVDKHLEFRKAVHVRIKSLTATSMEIDYLDAAHEFDDVGRLRWLGRIRAWSVLPGQTAQFLVVAGRDDDGDYTAAADGQPGHWTAEDATTGKPIHPQ